MKSPIYTARTIAASHSKGAHDTVMVDLGKARDLMVEHQLSRRGIVNRKVLAAMGDVAREVFVEPGYEEFAYEDTPLAIGYGQTISQPYIVALMISEADIKPGDTVLEVGAGSGYAAAVASRLAGHVYAIERVEELAGRSRDRLRGLGYHNVDVRAGDGTGGWPEAGPFDVILVSAGGPAIPIQLQDQLDIGGRMLIPIGPRDEQRLLKIVRRSATRFEETDLGGVRFVPLVNTLGWSTSSHEAADQSVARAIRDSAEPLPPIEDPRFAHAFDRYGTNRLVLLGEASHGTCEFYRARAAISRRLIEEHGFRIIAIEADWPDTAVIDRYIRHRPQANPISAFQRFPRWMWRNREFFDFVEWLRQFNQGRQREDMAEIRGIDIYNLHGSIASVLHYLDRSDPEAAAVARQRYGCLTPWQNDPAAYGRAVLTESYKSCESAAVDQCREMLKRHLDDAARDVDGLFDARENARLVADGERYYRAMFYGGAAAWNLRDRHMFETLERVLEARKTGRKAIVWAHNSHVGDARATDMGARGEINIGELCRKRYAAQTAIVGFGTHHGDVAAASDWDGERQTMALRPGLEHSAEAVFHGSGSQRCLLDLTRPSTARDSLMADRLQRFIGVVYRPASERDSHYQFASLARQFDAYVWFDHTTALSAEPDGRRADGLSAALPFGN